MDSSVALLSSSALGSTSSKLPADKLKELKAKHIPQTGHKQQSSDVSSPAHSSSTTAAHSLLRTSSTEAPDTPTITNSWFKHNLIRKRSRRSSSELHPALLGSTSGQSTQGEGGILSHSSSTVPAYHAHSIKQPTSSSSSSRPRSQAVCEPSLTTRIKRRIAWTAKVLQRRASCPANMQLQRLPTSSTSSAKSFPGAAPRQQQQQQQQEMQPLMKSRPLSSSQSWPRLHPVLTTGSGSAAVEHDATSSCACHKASATCGPKQAQQQQQHVALSQADSSYCQHPSTPPATAPLPAAAAAAAQCAASCGSVLVAKVPALQLPPQCTEITPCDSSSSSSADAPGSPSSQDEHEADSGDSPAAESYPECLFSDTPPRITNSFTTKVYTSNQGQRVAVVWAGNIIMAAFVKEPSGEVWECDPDQVNFSGGSGSQTQTAAANTACAAGGEGLPGLLTADAAARVYHALNRSGSSSRRSGCGSCISSASGASLSSSSGGSRSSWCSSAGSTPGACTDSNTDTVSGASCSSSHSSRPSIASKQQQQQQRRQQPGMFAFLTHRITEWRAQRMAQQQRQAAAYLEELEEAAHQAMRLAGCQSFVLPRHWSDSARKQAEEQRRLRVLLTAYRA